MRLSVLKSAPAREGDGVWARIGAFLAGFDFLQLLPMAMIIAVGILFIYSTGLQVGSGEALGAWRRQLMWFVLGCGVWGFFAVTDYRKFEPLSYLVFFAALVLLVAVLIVGPRIYGAKRWLILNFGFFRQQLQPSELGKIGMILVLASVLGNRWFHINRWSHLGLAALIVAVPFGLVVIEPDLGGSVIFLPIAAAMIFAAGIGKKKILFLAVLMVLFAGFFGAHEYAAAKEYFGLEPFLKEYHHNRIATFWNPESDPLGRGYNALQARVAVGSGGFFGKGVGQGTQGALGFIPYTVVNNDFIFSVIAEETGFAGCVALLILYMLLLAGIFRTAWIAVTPYGRYLCIGFGVMFFCHVFINMGMSVGLTPVTGLPLPLVSYGGTFMVTTMAMLGVIQSVYRVARKTREEAR